MSKEVEVNGIKLTASVPEDLQISAGWGTGNLALKTTNGAADASFVEVAGTSRTLSVGAPSEDAGSTDWKNSIDISDFYTFGRLTPATSISGADIYYTSDATGEGKTLPEDRDAYDQALSNKSVATFAQADTSATSILQGWADPAKADQTNTDKTGGGYYIDIPVWFRTSIASATNDTVLNLAVKASINEGRNASTGAAENTSDPALYKAARVSIINASGSAQGALADGATAGAIMDMSTNYYHTMSGDPATLQTSGTVAPASAYTVNAATATNATANTWAAVDWVKQATGVTAAGLAERDVANDTTPDTVVVVPKSVTDGKYGDATKYIIRVWLEGEDVNCWNETAAQDFQIDLRFIRIN